jgi:integrase/recombinase XerC
VQRVEADTIKSQAEFLRRLFERELKSEGKSETTINRYGLSIRGWLAFSEAMNFPPMVTREHVTEFLAHRQGKVAANTVRNDYMALRRWFRYLRELGEIREDPMVHLKQPKVTEKLPNPYTDDELRRMLKVCQGKDLESLRNTAILWVLFDTGLRASEMCSLTVGDVDLNAERILIRGKGRRERLVRLGTRAQRAVYKYLRARRTARPELWLGRGDRPLTRSGLFELVERVCAKANVTHPGVHRFRHTAATRMADLGMPETELRLLFGWTSPMMAARYTHSTARDRALRAHRQYSPADNLAL